MKSMTEREREALPKEEQRRPQAERVGLWRILFNSLLVAIALLGVAALFFA
jgi:hypothetical protein